MAQPTNLKPFYWGLAALAVAGAGWIWAATNRGNAVSYAAPVPAADVAAAAAFAGYVRGSDSAPVEVNEYADFQCPACGRFWVLTFHDVEQRLIASGLVRWRFHDRPLEMHPHARAAAHAAACADEQGRFWEMHDQLFGNQGAWFSLRNAEGAFRSYAQAVGLDLTKYDDCMKTGRYRARIQAEAEAADHLGITSTPTLVIGQMRIAEALPYDRLKRIVDSVATKSATR